MCIKIQSLRERRAKVIWEFALSSAVTIAWLQKCERHWTQRVVVCDPGLIPLHLAIVEWGQWSCFEIARIFYSQWEKLKIWSTSAKSWQHIEDIPLLFTCLLTFPWDLLTTGSIPGSPSLIPIELFPLDFASHWTDSEAVSV